MTACTITPEKSPGHLRYIADWLERTAGGGVFSWPSRCTMEARLHTAETEGQIAGLRFRANEIDHDEGIR